MRPVLLAALLGIALLADAPAAAPPADSTQLWFTPGPGTVDMLRLFEAPGEWEQAREAMDVFEFYQGHTLTQATPGEGPNRYDAFVRVDAFRKLAGWGKRIAIEMAAVKEHYCTPDATGMQASVNATLESLRNIEAAGGRVTYIALDEPFIGGLSRRCGGPAFAPTADRLAVYLPAIRRAYPAVRIGLIEPYPVFSVAQFTEILRLLADRGLAVDFLHADARRPDRAPGRVVFGAEMLQLRDLAAQYRIPFGVIVWGDPGDSDALYAADALRNADELGAVFRNWEVLPDRVIIQSWALSRGGQFITPRNLPEGTPNTHTWLINEINRRLHTPKGRTLLPARPGF
jgi:hypothetical protein